MKTYQQILLEAKGKHAVVVHGSFQPPTKQHEEMIRKALSMPGDHHVVVTHKDGPLTAEEKKSILQKAFPNHKKIFTSTDEKQPSIHHVLQGLFDQNYTHVSLVHGDHDQQQADKAVNANSKFNVSPDGKDRKGYAFNQIKSIPHEGIRTYEDEAAKLAKTGNKEELKKCMSNNLSDEDMDGIIGKFVSRGNAAPQPKKPDVVREEYKEGKLFNIGDPVMLESNKVGKIVNLGTNYVTVLSEGKFTRKWITDVVKTNVEVKESATYQLTEDQKKIFEGIVDHEDQYAVMNCIKAYSSLCNMKNINENFNKYKIDYDRSIKYFNKFNISLDNLSEAEDTLLVHAMMNGYIDFKVIHEEKIDIVAKNLNEQVKAMVDQSYGKPAEFDKVKTICEQHQISKGLFAKHVQIKEQEGQK